MSVCWRPAWCECPDRGPLVYVPPPTACTAIIRDGTLVCVRTDAHTTHQFEASYSPDRHDRAEVDE